MKVFGIDVIRYSDGALREGVMYDMLGRFASEDVRDRSVQALILRYSVDKSQAQRVVKTCHKLFKQLQNRLGLKNDDADLLRRAAYLHEIGLAISHSGYHKHSAYLLEHSDVPGFSQVDQLRMAQLVYNHRRKLKTDAFDQTKMIGGDSLVHLCLLLRLAVLINHSRSEYDDLPLKLSILDDNHWQAKVVVSSEDLPLLISDLEEEVEQFAKWGIRLDVVGV